MWNAVKSGLKVTTKWVLSHKKIVVGGFLAVCAFIGAAIGIKKGDDQQLVEAGEDPDLLEAPETPEESPTEEESPKKE